MDDVFAAGTSVVVYLHSPREKVFGVVAALQPAGVSLRGIDLAAFDDWVRQVARGDDHGLGLVTLFFPMNRVERIERDETVGGLEGFADRFRRGTGRSVAEAAGSSGRRQAADGGPTRRLAASTRRRRR